jgi:hypothetical protein
VFQPLFQIDHNKNFLLRKFKVMKGNQRRSRDLRRLTMAIIRGISHAHAGLAELRPPLPSAPSRSKNAVACR